MYITVEVNYIFTSDYIIHLDHNNALKVVCTSTGFKVLDYLLKIYSPTTPPILIMNA